MSELPPVLGTEAEASPSEGVVASTGEEILFEIQVTNGLLGHCYSLLLCMVVFTAAKTLYRLVKHNVTDHIDF